MDSRRAFLGRASAAAAGLALGGCAGPAPAPRGAARLPLGADPSTFDFARARDTSSIALSHLVGDALVGFDERTEPVPRLAESWAWSNDHLTLTFRLRPARWHDGRPVTALDVVHTYERNVDARTGIPDRAQAFASVAAVEPVGAAGVRVRYRAPFAPALAAWWTAPLVPRHLPPADDGPPIGCGPFRLTARTTGQRLTLEGFAGYHGGAPGLARIEIEVLRDIATRFAALRAGQLDLAPLLPDHAAQLEADPALAARLRVETYRVLFFQYVAWRMDGSNPFFADPRVRRAMTLAIDRGALASKILRGGAVVATSSFHPDSWAADPQAAPLPFDPREAGALLDAAGWVRPAGGGVRRRDGRELAFTFVYPNGAEAESIAVFLAANLRGAGVDARLDGLEWTQYQARMRDRAYDALLGFRTLDADPDCYELWHSSQARDGVNYAGFADPEVDRWLERARASFDRAERVALYRRIARRLHEAQPDTFLAHPVSRYAVDRRLEGVRGTPLGLLTHWPGPFGWRWREDA